MMPCLSLLCFMVFGPPDLVLGDAPHKAPASPAPGTSVQAFGQRNQCLAWTDGCVVCTSPGPGKPGQCSTPGIACTPHDAVTCTTPAP